MKITQRIITLGALIGLLAPGLSVATAHARALPAAAATDTTASTDSKRLVTIKTKGDAELGRRIDTLGKLLLSISTATQLSDTSKQALSEQVSAEVTALTTLRLKLAVETQVADAVTDISNMVTEYRVYALVVPKVQLIKAADDGQIAEEKLSNLHTKLITRITNAKDAGKNVDALQTKLDDMNANIVAAQALSTSVATSVLPLQPTDYDNDHAVLSGYRDKLKTAKTDAQNAYEDAKAIVAGLKNM